MTAAVRIQVAEAKNVLAVREAALRFTPEDAPEAAARSRVWLHTDTSQLTAVPVKPGLTDGAYTEVKPLTDGALEPEQRVAVGLLSAGQANRAQPGVSLGNKK
jgi:hypothetical protein